MSQRPRVIENAGKTQMTTTSILRLKRKSEKREDNRESQQVTHVEPTQNPRESHAKTTAWSQIWMTKIFEATNIIYHIWYVAYDTPVVCSTLDLSWSLGIEPDLNYG